MSKDEIISLLIEYKINYYTISMELDSERKKKILFTVND